MMRLSVFLACLTVSVVVAGAMVSLNNGFGAGDLWAFFGWSIPFAGSVTLLSKGLELTHYRFSLTYNLVISVLTGLIAGTLWTLVAAILINPWFGTFSFPVLPCWIAGGTSGMVASLRAKATQKGFVVIMLVLIATVCLVVLVGTAPIWERLAGDQELQQVSIKWEPGLQLLETSDTDVNDKDLAYLSSIGLTGRIKDVGSGTYGRRAKNARVVIVAYRQVDGPVELRQPDGVEIFYIQGEDGWTMHPSDAPTLERTIRLWPDENNPTWATRYSVENSDGSRQGGTAFTWPQD